MGFFEEMRPALNEAAYRVDNTTKMDSGSVVRAKCVKCGSLLNNDFKCETCGFSLTQEPFTIFEEQLLNGIMQKVVVRSDVLSEPEHSDIVDINTLLKAMEMAEKDNDNEDVYEIAKIDKMLDEGDASEQYDLGVSLIIWHENNEDNPQAGKYFKKAIQLIEQSAQKGNAQASYYLGEFYCEDAIEKAEEWYKKAVNQGSNDACEKMGDLLLQRGYMKEAIEYYKIAADKGHVRCCAKLGNIYDSKRKFNEGLRWYCKSKGIDKKKKEELNKRATLLNKMNDIINEAVKSPIKVGFQINGGAGPFICQAVLFLANLCVLLYSDRLAPIIFETELRALLVFFITLIVGGGCILGATSDCYESWVDGDSRLSWMVYSFSSLVRLFFIILLCYSMENWWIKIPALLFFLIDVYFIGDQCWHGAHVDRHLKIEEKEVVNDFILSAEKTVYSSSLKYNRCKTILLGIISACLIVVLGKLLPVASSDIITGWGDSAGGRTVYTTEQVNDEDILGESIVFNSISDWEPIGGDERNFVVAREDTGLDEGEKNIWLANEISVSEEGIYLVRLYVHNDNPNGMNAIAEDVRAHVVLPLNEGYSLGISGTIDSSNSKPDRYWDGVTFISEHKFYVDYVEGSALIENNGIGAKGGCTLSDSIITSDGVLIGYDNLDGKIPGGAQYAAYITLKVRVVFVSDE